MKHRKTEAEPSDELNQLKAHFQRVQADLQNMQRRAASELQSARQAGLDRAMLSFLPAIDNLDRAFVHLDQEARAHISQYPAVLKWLTGLEHLQIEFEQIALRLGYRKIEPTGQPFSPDEHEAIGVEQQTNIADGEVTTTVLSGWQNSAGQLIRPAQVIVNHQPEPTKES